MEHQYHLQWVLLNAISFKIIIDEIDDDEDTPQPFIAVQLGKEGIQTYAFIDSRTDGNTISYELFEQLKGVELQELGLFSNPIQAIQQKNQACVLYVYVLVN